MNGSDCDAASQGPREAGAGGADRSRKRKCCSQPCGPERSLWPAASPLPAAPVNQTGAVWPSRGHLESRHTEGGALEVPRSTQRLMGRRRRAGLTQTVSWGTFEPLQGPSILAAVAAVLGRSLSQSVPSFSTFDLTCFLIRI